MRAVIKFLSLQGKAPKEIHAILTETLAYFLPGRAKDLSAPLYIFSIDTSQKCNLDLLYTANVDCQQIFKKYRSYIAGNAL